MSSSWNIGALIVVFVVTFLIWFHRRFPNVTGFQNKTLWEWMTILIVPLVLGIGGVILNQAQEERQRDLLEIQVAIQVAQATEDAATAIAGVSATERSNRATLAAQAVQSTARVIEMVQANSTATAMSAEADLQAAEAEADEIGIRVARENATAQAEGAATAVQAIAEPIRSTQTAEAMAAAEAQATTDAVNARATLAALQVPTPTPPPTSTFTPIPPPPATATPLPCLYDGPVEDPWDKYKARLGCPKETRYPAYARQEFENGYLFWTQNLNQYTVAVGKDKGTWYNIAEDEIEDRPCAEAYPLLVRGIRRLYCSSTKVRQDLQEATDEEVGAGIAFQDFDHGLIWRDEQNNLDYIFFEENGKAFVREGF